MAGINVQVKKGAVDVSNKVLQYDRQTNICSGVGTFNIIFDDSLSISPGDLFYLYEEGTLKGKYWTGTVSRDVEGSISADCQDGSKWLQDYFIETTYNYAGHSSKHWIEEICSLAQISITFVAGAGEGYIQPYGQFFGLEPAYDVVLRMCQQSGWYFYFNGSGTCVVGSLLTTVGSYAANLVDTDIISEEIDSSDANLRNRVIIWGNNVFLTMNRRTSWDRGATDKRTVVYTNNYITDYETASEIGSKILDEYAQIVSQKIFTLVGGYDIDPGDRVKCTTHVWNGVGRATTVGSQLSDSHGLRTTLVLDERCPRLFAYVSYDTDSEYVYVGTKSHGVYRKTISGSSWSSYSTGITNLNIRDLKIKNGVLVATTDGVEVYRRFAGDTSWVQITPDGWTEEVNGVLTDFYTTNWIAAGVGINSITGEIIVGYNDTSSGNSWVMVWRSSTDFTMTQVIADDGKENINVMDVDHNDTYTLLTGGFEAYNPTKQNWIDGGEEEQGTIGDLIIVSQNRTAMQKPFDMVSLGSTFTNDECSLIEGIGRPMCLKNGKFYHSVGLRIYAIDLNTNVETEYYMDTTNYLLDFSYSTSHLMWVEDNERYVHFLGKHYNNNNRVHLKADLVNLDYTVIDDDLQTTYGIPWTLSGDEIGYPLSNSGVGIQNRSWCCWIRDKRLESPGAFDASSQSLYHYLEMYVYDLETETFSSSIGPSYYPTGVTNNADWYILSGNDNSSMVFPTEDGGFSAITCDTIYWTERPPGSETQYAQAYYMTKEYTPDVGFSTPAKKVIFTTSNATGNYSNRYSGAMSMAFTKEDMKSYVALRWTVINNVTSEFLYGLYIVTLPGDEPVSIRTGNIDPSQYNTIDDTVLYRARNTCVLPLTKKSKPPLAITTHDLYPSTEWKIENVITGTRWGNSWLGFDGDYYPYDVALTVDELDNTILIYNPDGGYEYKAKNIFTGTTVKTYTGLSSADDYFFNTRKHIVTLDIDSSYRLYAFSGVANIPTSGSLSLAAFTNSYVTTAGDSYGVLGLYSLSGMRKYASVDVAHSSPSTFFGGTVYSGVKSGEMYFSQTAVSGDWSQLKNTFNGKPFPRVLDARTVDVLGPVYTVSGIALGGTYDYKRYVYSVLETFSGVDSGVYFKGTDDVNSRWYNLAKYAKTHRFETTNFLGGYPYMFLSTSGAPSKFYQKDGDETTWAEKSTGLPSSNILVIRVDDEL